MVFALCGGSSSRRNVKLQQACRAGDWERVQRQLHKGADVYSTTVYGETPLYLALEKGNDDIALHLMKKQQQQQQQHLGDNVGKATPTNRDGWLPLHAAAYFGRDSIVQHCLEPTARDATPVDCQTLSHAHETPLHLACRKGHVTTAALLIAHGADVLAHQNQRRDTPLHYAARQGHVEVVFLLVQNLQLLGQSLNQRNQAGETPLFGATHEQRVAVAKLLLQAGANPNLRNANEQTPLHAAAMKGCLPLVEFLLFTFPSQVDVNALDAGDRTPLYWASRNGHVSTVQCLCQAGADVTLGKSPTVGASTFGHTAILQFLHQQGAATTTSATKRTTVHMAAQQGHLETVHYLVQQCGASIHDADHWGFTPLHYAAAGNHIELINWLLQGGANVNDRTLNGETALDLASYKNYGRAVQVLKSKSWRVQPRPEPCSGHNSPTTTMVHSFTTDPIVEDEKSRKIHDEHMDEAPAVDPTEFSDDASSEAWSQAETLVTGTTLPTWLSSKDTSLQTAPPLSIGNSLFKSWESDQEVELHVVQDMTDLAEIDGIANIVTFAESVVVFDDGTVINTITSEQDMIPKTANLGETMATIDKETKDALVDKDRPVVEGNQENFQTAESEESATDAAPKGNKKHKKSKKKTSNSKEESKKLNTTKSNPNAVGATKKKSKPIKSDKAQFHPAGAPAECM